MESNNGEHISNTFSLIKIILTIMAIVNILQGDAKVYDYGIIIGCGITFVFEIIEKVSKK